MWLKILMFMLFLYLVHRLIRNLLLPPPAGRRGGRVPPSERPRRVIDPRNTDIEDAHFKDIE